MNANSNTSAKAQASKTSRLPLPKSVNPLTEALRSYSGFYSDAAKSEHAALVAVAEAAIRAQRNLQARLHIDGRENFTFGETLETLDETLANLAAVREGKASK